MTKNESEALEVINDYRRKVDDAEKKAMETLAVSWTFLMADIRDALQSLRNPDPANRSLSVRWQTDLDRHVFNLFANEMDYADSIMTDLTIQTARLGAASVDKSAEKIEKRTWNRVSISGLFSGGIFRASRDALARIPAAISEKLTDLISQASSMAEEGIDWVMNQLGDVLSEAWRGLQRIVRTAAEQLFRRGQQEQRRQTPIRYWRRIANHETACLACILLEGTVYNREEDFSDHPNGRCCIVPCEDPTPDQSGRKWLEEQDEETQRKIMGKGRYEAWQRGDITLDQMTDVVPNEEFGPQPHIIPLRDLGLGR